MAHRPLKYIFKTLLEEVDLCGRLPYLHRHFLGKGVAKDVAPDASKSVGAAIHKGVETIFNTGSLTAGRTAAADEWIYDTQYAWRNMPEHIIELQRREYLTLIGQVLAVWFRVRYPAILAGYDVVNAEQKSSVDLAGFVMTARPDAILTSKLDGRLYDHSLKTVKTYNHFAKHPQALIDIQGLTEVVNIAMNHANGKLARVGGVLMEYLVVGKMSKDEPVIWHPALRGWRRPSPGGFSGSFEYAWRWEAPNPDYDPSRGRAKGNFKTKSLSTKDGWERVACWEHPGGADGWLDDLLARRMVPYHLDPVAEMIYAPEVYVRAEGQIESFLAQTVAWARGWNDGLRRLDAGEQIDNLPIFRQQRSSCLKFGEEYRCEMWDICWKGAGRDPGANGYVARKSSIDREKERLASEVERENSSN